LSEQTVFPVPRRRDQPPELFRLQIPNDRHFADVP